MPFLSRAVTASVSVYLFTVSLVHSDQTHAQDQGSSHCSDGSLVCLEETVTPETTETLSISPTVSDDLSEESVVINNEVTTETYTEEQEHLVSGITRNLKYRNLTRPPGKNAAEKIIRLRELHPWHDYSVNGEKYIARILILMGQQSVGRGDLKTASRHLLTALKFDPKVNKQQQLKSSIAKASRERESQLQSADSTVTAYLPRVQTQSLSVQREQTITDKNSDENLADTRFVAPVMVAIPSGSFLMGSETGAEDEKPVHHVVVDAFSMSKHEITMQQFRVFAIATGRPAQQFSPEQSNLPATDVSWHDAVAYTDWLREKTKRPFRLATESEWEYAARAGTTTTYFSGDDLRGVANCVECGSQWGGKSPAPVGSFSPNEFGLYDMHGNVWEWVQDCWTDNYNGRTKSAASVTVDDCARHVLRGGSWYNDADFARSSYRGNETPHFRDGGVGFRVVHDGL